MLALKIISAFICALFFSCNKEYIEEIFKNIEPVVVYKAFYGKILPKRNERCICKSDAFSLETNGGCGDSRTDRFVYVA